MSLNTIGSDTDAIFAGNNEDCWYATPLPITPVGCESHFHLPTSESLLPTVNVFPAQLHNRLTGLASFDPANFFHLQNLFSYIQDWKNNSAFSSFDSNPPKTVHHWLQRYAFNKIINILLTCLSLYHKQMKLGSRNHQYMTLSPTDKPNYLFCQSFSTETSTMLTTPQGCANSQSHPHRSQPCP